MELKVKEQIKTILAQENIKQKDLAKMLSEKTGHLYSPDNLSKKINRQPLTYNEVLEIVKILGTKLNLLRMYSDEKRLKEM